MAFAPPDLNFSAPSPDLRPLPIAHSDLAAIGLDLLPVAAVVVRQLGDTLTLEVANAMFAATGLTSDPATIIAELGPRIRDYLQSSELMVEFAWVHGALVDCRHYQVRLSRRPSALHEQRCLLTLIDQTSERRTEQNLRREMLTDSLTGLPNRSGFSDQLETVIAAGNPASRRFAVVVIDLERFSRVNACLGSMAGDELLITVARRMKSTMRVNDVLARTGGDEFGLLLDLAESDGDIGALATRVRSVFAQPFRLADFEVRVDCAIGVAFGTGIDDDAEDLIRNAQFALKRSKSSGHAEAYQSYTFDIARRRFATETELRRAIDADTLELHYQPIIDLGSGRIVSFEALARWRTEEGESISPDVFIPVAEESGLIVPLGRWAIERAAQTLAHWDAAAGRVLPVSLAVNLSAIQIQRDEIGAVVARALHDNDISGRRFTLELTESAISNDPGRVTRSMYALKELGTTLAMDDFGTGYSNLAYLQRLPIDVLKIDRSFVTGMLADRDKVSIVRAILSLANALGINTTAEGIETNELAQTLAALGCNYGQGFLYARPLPADAAYALLAAPSA